MHATGHHQSVTFHQQIGRAALIFCAGGKKKEKNKYLGRSRVPGI